MGSNPLSCRWRPCQPSTIELDLWVLIICWFSLPLFSKKIILKITLSICDGWSFWRKLSIKQKFQNYIWFSKGHAKKDPSGNMYDACQKLTCEILKLSLIISVNPVHNAPRRSPPPVHHYCLFAATKSNGLRGKWRKNEGEVEI